jgi:YNFM family putative membrane transporter
MTEMPHLVAAPHTEMHSRSAGALLRFIVIALTAFLTVVDLFATQAILPSLARHYGVAPAAMGFAVNASTMGMAVAGLAVGYFSREIDRRRGILISLVLLAIPTAAPGPAEPACRADRHGAGRRRDLLRASLRHRFRGARGDV